MARASAGRAAQRPVPLPPLLTAEEETAHREFAKTLGAEPVWLQYLAESPLPGVAESAKA